MPTLARGVGFPTALWLRVSPRTFKARCWKRAALPTFFGKSGSTVYLRRRTDPDPLASCISFRCTRRKA